MPQLAIASPLGKGEFADQPGEGPGRVSFGWFIGERALLLDEFVHAFTQPHSQLNSETGSHLARVPQLAVVIIADQQGTEALRTAPRLGESPDHQFLPLCTLELKPVGGTAMLICRCGTFGNDALPSIRTGAPGIRFTFLRAMGRVSHGAIELDRAFQQHLALKQRKCSRVVTVQMEHIEEIEMNADLGPPRLSERSNLHALLESLEAGM